MKENRMKKEENKNNVCYGCYYYDHETDMCVSHEGCIRADDKDIDMRILDMFCCSGGASMGIYQAAYKLLNVEIVGIDIETQLRYPFNRRTGDALNQPEEFYQKFDFIWASPPCQRYSKAVHPNNKNKYPDLVKDTINLLEKIGKPYVIENVEAAPIRKDLLLCGEMFGLKLFKHRYFQIKGFKVIQPIHEKHKGSVKYGDYVTTAGRGCEGTSKIKLWQQALGIEWERNLKKLAEAVPPAYSKYIFEQYLMSCGYMVDKG